MLRISRKSAGRTKPQKPQKARANTSQFDRYLTVQEEKLFFSNLRKQKLSSIYAQRDYWMCVLLRKTAIRINPLVHLTLGQAKKALFTERFRIGEHNKCKKVQDIYLHKEAGKALKELISINQRMAPNQPDDAFLLCSRNGNGLSARSIQLRIQKWGGEVGLDEMTPHWLRHTWAKRYLDEHGGTATALLRIQAVLGHTNISTTAIYTKPSKEDIKEAMTS